MSRFLFHTTEETEALIRQSRSMRPAHGEVSQRLDRPELSIMVPGPLLTPSTEVIFSFLDLEALRTPVSL